MIRQAAYKDFAEGVIGFKEELSTIQTTDATITTLVAVMMPDDGRGYMIITMIAAELSGATRGLVGKKLIHWRSSGGATTVVSSTDIVADSKETITTATWSVDASGGTLRIRVTGAAGLFIDWYAAYDNNYVNLTPP